MARVLLIANPVASRTTEAVVRAVVHRMEREGWSVEVARTTRPGDARQLAEQGVRGGVDVVAVLGGDGTTMQAAAALVKTEIPLGILPGGTGNLLAGNLRIPRAPLQAAEVVLGGVRRPVDLGCVGRPDGAHYFAVAAGAGIDAQIMGGTEAAAKRRWGMAAYVGMAIRSIPDIRTREYSIVLDGTRIDTRATMVLVANCGEVFPPYLSMGRGILPDDGWFDVAIVRASGLRQALRVVWQVLRHHRPDLPPGLLEYRRAREVTVTAHPEQAVQLDGDSCGSTPFTAAMRPSAIQVLTPRGT